MQPGITVYTLREDEGTADHLLRQRFPGRREKTPPRSAVYLDTFDWRLLGAGARLCVLRRDGRNLLRLEQPGEAAPLECAIGKAPRFEWDLPRGPLRAALRRIVEMRRLAPVIRLRTHTETVRVLDGERKTVARLEVLRGTASRPGRPGRHDLPTVLRLAPVRGFDREAEAVRQTLETELGIRPAPMVAFREALVAVGHDPDGDLQAFPPPLDPDMRADAGLRRVYLALLDTIERNESGLLADLDSEYLHDFRVAVRRTRSALSQVREVFPAEVGEHFREEFRWLGQMTGPTRDMDVYLLKLPGFCASLPEATQQDLEPMEAFLAENQRREHRRMARALRSERQASLKRDWRAFLETVPDEAAATPDGARPVIDVARERIARAHARVLRKGGKIRPSTRAGRLHDLRIDCKKLRYLVTFFRGLFPPPEVATATRSLRRLQDVLGDFNDFEVQQHRLMEFATTMLAEGRAGAPTLVAVGRLVSELERRQAEERKRFHKRFDELNAEEARAAFATLCPPADETGGDPA